jgi:hypothetical protein
MTTKHRRPFRLDMVGLTVSVGAMIIAIVLIWFAGKVGDYHAMRKAEEISHQ